MFPGIAQKAVSNESNKILDYLIASRELSDHPGEFALYDWRLQILMVKATRNPVFNMILNDFAPLYGVLGKVYFQHKEARKSSLKYYTDLIFALTQKDKDIEKLVEKIMIQTQIIWKSIQ